MNKTVFISLPIEDLQTVIIDCVNSCLKTSKHISTQEPSERWFDLNELVNYDPEKRTKPTFYGYISNSTIPYHKRGKKLIFLKSEIDNWLKEGRKRTLIEIESEAENNLVKPKKRGLK